MLKSLVVFFLALILLGFFLPQIASTFFVKPYLEKRMEGKLEIKKVSLSWFGPQKFEGVHWTKGGIQATTEELQITTSLIDFFKEHPLTIKDPLTIKMPLTPELSAYMLKDINPLFITSFQSNQPVVLTVSEKNFSFPLPFSIEKLKAEGTLELGQVKCQNGKTLASILNLLSVAEANQMSVWFTPLAFTIENGILNTERMDALLANQIHVCTWGKIDLNQDQVFVNLGLPADTLENAFGLKNLAPESVLKIPIRGSTKDPQIDKKRALAQVAKMLFFKSDEAPPPKLPFPWEKK